MRAHLDRGAPGYELCLVSEDLLVLTVLHLEVKVCDILDALDVLDGELEVPEVHVHPVAIDLHRVTRLHPELEKY